MAKLVKPQVYLVGYTRIDHGGLTDYLEDSGNEAFRDDLAQALTAGVSEGEALCSFYAKLCYDTLSKEGSTNENVSGVRGIGANLAGCFDMGHSAVFEHCWLNFAVRNCSRVYETEQVRHRVGTAYSVRSGRYHRSRDVDIVFDPILEPGRDIIEEVQQFIEAKYAQLVERLGIDAMKDKDRKKKATSACRRIIPEGRAKDLGFSVNLTAIRHIIQTRTSRHSEWEIRTIWEGVYQATRKRFPLLYYGAKFEVVDDIIEVSGMKTHPYDQRG